MHVLALTVVMWIFVRRSENTGLSVYHALGAVILGMVGGLLGARIFYLLQHFQYTISNPEVLFDLAGGTTSWGAYLGGLCGFLFYLKTKKLQVLRYADILGASLGLGPFFGRWACFLNGCCYGANSVLPWAVQYPENSYAYIAHLHAGLIGPDAVLSLPVHPVQIYSSVAAFIIFMMTSLFWAHFKDRVGATFAFYWFVYGTFRFTIEFLRGESARFGILNLTMSQYICILLVVSGILFLIKKFSAITQKDMFYS
jgi:phosphatidylglycerol:prolipoprotein diacylglycerol transferase